MIYKAIGSGQDFSDLVASPGPGGVIAGIMLESQRKPAHVTNNITGNLELMRSVDL